MEIPTKTCKTCANYLIFDEHSAMCLIEDELAEHADDTLEFGIFVDCPCHDGDQK